MNYILSLFHLVMRRIKIKKRKEKNLIGKNFKYYISIAVFVCCLIIGKNMLTNTNLPENQENQNFEMTYIFHDYQWNQYILNDKQHGAADSYEYLFDSEVPEEVKHMTNSVSLADRDVESTQQDNENTVIININEDEIDVTSYKDDEISKPEQNTNENLKDNQISIDDILRELNIDNYDALLNDNDKTELTINIWNEKWIDEEINEDDEFYYIQKSIDGSVLVIQKEKYRNEWNINNIFYTTNDFSQIVDSIFIPVLIPRDELDLNNEKWINIDLINHPWDDENQWWINILPDYKNCTSPRWYTIVHWDSVLAYQQIEDAPRICNIERRFCRDGKLSGKYTQQWCYTNSNSYQNIQQWDIRYEYDVQPTTKWNNWSNSTNKQWWKRTNKWLTIDVKPLWTWSFAFDRPSQSFTNNLGPSDNVVVDPEVEQTSRPTRDCITPWGEEVKHWQFIQAFKHANWFNDAPCQTQFRLCSMWNLMWTYTESSCKPRDTSFIDWINWSPTWETYSQEKLEWVKKLIEYEQFYDRDYKRFTNSEALDKIMNILDS